MLAGWLAGSLARQRWKNKSGEKETSLKNVAPFSQPNVARSRQRLHVAQSKTEMAVPCTWLGCS